MEALVDRVTDEALALPVDARLGLVERLLASLNLPRGEEIDRAWAEEAERRVAQVDAGQVELLPGEEVFARIRARCDPPLSSDRCM